MLPLVCIFTFNGRLVLSVYRSELCSSDENLFFTNCLVRLWSMEFK